MKREKVRDWMTFDPVTVTPDTNLPQAYKLMRQENIRRLPVVEKGQLVGIVTYGDVRGAEPSSVTSLSIGEMNHLIGQLQISEFMTQDPVTITQEATIGQAALLMLKHKISALPVLSMDNKLVGIITESDIFRMVVRDWVRE